MASGQPRYTECDFHCHTALSGEAQSQGFDIAALFQAADELGLRYVGYSEHWHRDTSPDLFRRIRDEVERQQAHHAVKVFVSAEIDVLNSRGDLACDLDVAVRLLDYVAVAISHYGAPGSEQLLADRVDDTARMIEAACALPEVTLLLTLRSPTGAAWMASPSRSPPPSTTTSCAASRPTARCWTTPRCR